MKGKKDKETLPEEDIANESWATTQDPAKHSRPSASFKEGNETLPTLYQVVTDNEAYKQFADYDREREG